MEGGFVGGFDEFFDGLCVWGGEGVFVGGEEFFFGFGGDDVGVVDEGGVGYVDGVLVERFGVGGLVYVY